MVYAGAARNVAGKTLGQQSFGVSGPVLDDETMYEYVVAFHKSPVLIETPRLHIPYDDLNALVAGKFLPVDSNNRLPDFILHGLGDEVLRNRDGVFRHILLPFPTPGFGLEVVS